MSQGQIFGPPEAATQKSLENKEFGKTHKGQHNRGLPQSNHQEGISRRSAKDILRVAEESDG